MAAVHIMSLARGCGEKGHCQARLVSDDVFFILRVNVELRKKKKEEENEKKEKKKMQLVVLLQIKRLPTVASY